MHVKQPESAEAMCHSIREKRGVREKREDVMKLVNSTVFPPHQHQHQHHLHHQQHQCNCFTPVVVVALVRRRRENNRNEEERRRRENNRIEEEERSAKIETVSLA